MSAGVEFNTINTKSRLLVISQYCPIPRSDDDGPSSLWHKTKNWMRKHNHKGSPLTFLQEAKKIASTMTKGSESGIIVCGDFNAPWTTARGTSRVSYPPARMSHLTRTDSELSQPTREPDDPHHHEISSRPIIQSYRPHTSLSSPTLHTIIHSPYRCNVK